MARKQSMKQTPNKRRSPVDVATSALGRYLAGDANSTTWRCIVLDSNLQRLEPSLDKDITEQYPKYHIIRFVEVQSMHNAKTLEVLPPIQEDEVYFLVTQPQFSRLNWDAMLAEFPPLYDEFDQSSPFFCQMVDRNINTHGRHIPASVRTMIREFYRGVPPIEYEMACLRDEMVSNLTRAFRLSFFAPYNQNEKRTNVQISIDKTMNILNALGLGYITFDKKIYEKHKQTAAQKMSRKVFRQINFLETNDDPHIEAAKEQARKASELLDLWEDISQHVRFAIRLDRSELDDEKFVFDLVREYAEFICAEPAVDALAAGVPLEDIKFGE